MNHHLKQTLKLNSGPIPWFKMFLYGFSIALPLFFGKITNNFALSMLGSLFALVLGLIDHMGPFKQRISHLLISTFFLVLSLIAGILTIESIEWQIIILFISSFILGKSKDQGIELERIILFCILYFTTMSDSRALLGQIKPSVSFSLLGLISYFLFLGITHLFRRDPLPPIKSKRETFKRSLFAKENNYFAIIYALTNTLSFIVFKALSFERTYWIIGTILIVMLPDFYLGLYKSLQRIFGTILGVILAAFILNTYHSESIILLGVFISALLTPYGMHKNYWLGNLFIASMVIFFLETNLQMNVLHIAKMRALDISFGGIIAIFSSYFFLKKYFHNLKPITK